MIVSVELYHINGDRFMTFIVGDKVTKIIEDKESKRIDIYYQEILKSYQGFSYVISYK